MTDVPAHAIRHPRADARRNHARVLQAAQDAFAAEGKDVPLDEIARRAGVGAGTVYRHFPSKDALFEAVIVDRVGRLAADTRALAGADDPGPAFFAFFADTVERVAFNQALVTALDSRARTRASVVSSLKQEFHDAVAVLLERAQRVGAVRPDVTAEDVIALVSGCLAMESYRGSPGRMVALACDALRPAAATPLPPAVTKPLSYNETRHRVSDETAADSCTVCGAHLPAGSTGRPRRYCSAACRQKAHRLRTR